MTAQPPAPSRPRQMFYFGARTTPPSPREPEADAYGLALDDDEVRLMVELNGMVGSDPALALLS